MEHGVYIHVPWCRARCPYCAFNVSVRRARPHDALRDGILATLARRRALFGEAPPATLFFGGGTPSLMPVRDIAAIVGAVGATDEVSLEANPHDLDDAFVGGLVDAGITRLSVGVQTFDRALGVRLGRSQDASAAPDALRRARAAGFRSLSLDLIFAAPGQTASGLAEDLARALDLGVDHVSLYGLTIEEGTAFARGGRAPADDDAWRELYDLAVTTLADAGLHRYEVSNFARRGHRCRHNEHYWLARPWLGIGPGAHGWLPDGTRTVDVVDVDAWLAAAAEGRDPVGTREVPTGRVLAAELLGSGLRHVDGFPRERLRALTGMDVRVPEVFLTRGWVREVDESIVLSAEALAVVDAVVARLVESLVPERRCVGMAQGSATR